MNDLNPFTNRLRKNFRHWGKWARRREIGCFRIYDRDIPEFPFAIDWYEGRCHAQLFARKEEACTEEQQGWEAAASMAIREALEIPEEALAFKRRQRQKGLQQYKKAGQPGAEFVVGEGGLRFLVNLHTYLDSGLFLDHRETRALIRAQATGRRFLNLFAYTGSFSVYAADGGAVESLTVDLSNTYQQWAGRNFRLNGMDPEQHRLLRADVFQFLKGAAAREGRFDLIMLDPPSFSNSAKMQEMLDVQRDHPRLIHSCLELLNPGGTLFFSNNLQTFRFDPSLEQETGAKEITRQTVPEDFRRHRPHHCWRITP